MRKLLQNKAVVVGLVVVAVACVANSFVKRPPGRAPMPVAARVITEAVPMDPGAFPLRPTLKIATNFAGWLESTNSREPARDPFRATQFSLIVTSAVASTSAPAPPIFVVQAISIEGDRAIAVVNRRVVMPGDRLEGYILDSIQATQVFLRGPAGPVAAGLRPASRSAPKASLPQ